MDILKNLTCYKELLISREDQNVENDKAGFFFEKHSTKEGAWGQSAATVRIPFDFVFWTVWDKSSPVIRLILKNRIFYPAICMA